MDRHTLPTKIIHYSQRPETSSVKQIIRHEIHTPALIDTDQDRTLLTMTCMRGAFAQVEAFQTVNPVCFLVVNRPAFPPQLNMNTRATVADPSFRYLPDTQGYRPIIPPALPVVNGSALHQQSSSPSDTDTVSPAENASPDVSEPASELLFQYLLQHLLVQTQVSHQFLQPQIFILQLPQTPQFGHAQTGEFLLPVIKVASEMPIFRQTSPSRVPVSACFRANAICSSV